MILSQKCSKKLRIKKVCPLVITFLNHNGRNYLEGKWRGLAATTGVIHQLLKFHMLLRKMSTKTYLWAEWITLWKTVCSYLFLCSFLLSYGKGLDIYCAHSAVGLYKSNVVRTLNLLCICRLTAVCIFVLKCRQWDSNLGEGRMSTEYRLAT